MRILSRLVPASDTSPFRGTMRREAREILTRDEEKKSTKSCSRRDAESVEKLKTKRWEGKGREGKRFRCCPRPRRLPRLAGCRDEGSSVRNDGAK